MLSHHPAGVWSFGPFRLDCVQFLLQRDGADVEMDRACVEILATLFSHCGEVVTKDELLEAAWSGRIVSENSLTKAIGRLRTVLGDSDMVSTVHGYGYRFSGKARFQPEVVAERRDENIAIRPGDAVPLRPGWTFVSQLGAGGSSEVWSAQGDGAGNERAIKIAKGESGLLALKREVALHRLMGDADDAGVGLVPLLGWNLTEPPFFVEMPLVETGNLRHWVEQASPPLQARLDVMACLAANVARLHALGIIHKDLKPENILVRLRDGVTEPLLTDFGAGWLSGTGAVGALPPLSTTFANALRDSPQMASALYAAPEVLRGEVPTTSADVYALGVMLYQMVVGDLQRPLGSDWERDVHDDVLRSDIHDAASSDLSRRIASAQVLAERLDTLDRRRAALIEHRQVQDQIASDRHRIVRARLRLRIATALGAVLIVGLISTGYMYWRSERERSEAVAEAHRSQAMLGFLTDDILSAGDPYGNHGNEVTLRDAVNAAARQVDRRFAADPPARAGMHQAIAKVYQGLGEYGLAIQHGGIAARLADDSLGMRAQMAGILMDLASEEVDADQRAVAEKTLARAAAAAQEAPEPGKVMQAVWATRAELRYEEGRYSESHADAERVLAAGPASDGSPDDPLANAWWYAALSSEELGAFARSEHEYRALIALREKTLGPNHPYTAWAYSNYGALLAKMGRAAQAEAMFDKAESLFIVALGKDHPDTTSPRSRRAQMYLMQRRWADALPILESILEIRRRKLGPDHAWTRGTSLELADAYVWLGRLDDADRLVRLATPPSGVFDDDADLNINLIQVQQDIAYGRGAFAQALTKNAQLLQATRAVHSEKHPMYASGECMAGRILLAQKQYAEARTHIEKCDLLLSTEVMASHPYRIEARSLLADLQSQKLAGTATR